MRARTLLTLGAAAGAAAFGYASVVERNWFVLREVEVPLLAPGMDPLRVLHISDIHLTPGRQRLMSWIRTLDTLEPDLVVNTGDSLAHERSVSYLVDALGPLLGRPGLFVFGSNDLYSPKPRNPARYLWRTSEGEHTRMEPDLPWRELRDEFTAAGWMDLNNQRGRLKAGGLDLAVAGVHDPHVRRDRYDQVAGLADPDADLRVALMHSPEPRILDRFESDGYDLLLAGHTHGGQLCLPGYGALVTNCGLDRSRVSGLHRHGDAWLHVSAGLGTSPYAPARFSCRPEATLLTLVPRLSVRSPVRGSDRVGTSVSAALAGAAGGGV